MIEKDFPIMEEADGVELTIFTINIDEGFERLFPESWRNHPTVDAYRRSHWTGSIRIREINDSGRADPLREKWLGLFRARLDEIAHETQEKKAAGEQELVAARERKRERDAARTQELNAAQGRQRALDAAREHELVQERNTAREQGCNPYVIAFLKLKEIREQPHGHGRICPFCAKRFESCYHLGYQYNCPLGAIIDGWLKIEDMIAADSHSDFQKIVAEKEKQKR